MSRLDHSDQFFLDWVEERIQRVPAERKNPEKLREVLAYHEKAKRFWQDALVKASAE